MKIKKAICDFIYKNTSFPNGCKHGNELNWMFKDCCPVCVNSPIESLSNKEYHEKYPAHNKIQLGVLTFYLCDVHLKELREIIK